MATAIVTDGAPLGGGGASYSIVLPSGVPTMGADMLSLHPITPGYFDVMRLRLLEGRKFEASDRAGAPLVAIINGTAARQFFPGEDAVGQIIKFRGPTTIVGVVQSVRLHGPEIDLRPELYVPLSQDPQDAFPFGTLVTRVDRPTAALGQRISAAVTPALGGTKPPEPQSLDEAFDKLTADRRFNAGVMALFGLLAMIVAATGIYGVLAFIVAQHVRVIGLQIALGATSRRVVTDVLGGVARYVVIGVALGLLGARATAGLFSSLVFGMTTTDAGVYVGVAGGLLFVALLAALLPAIRASRVDPLVALRAE